MKRQQILVFFTVLVLMGATAAAMAHAKANQKLGLPGVKTRPLAGSQNLEVLLPADLPGYTSKYMPQSAAVTNLLAADTSYGQQLYTGEDGFQSLANVVLMGSSRTSIHKPQVCLPAQGWIINDGTSREERVELSQSAPYALPVMRLNAAKQVVVNGQLVNAAAVFVYWFVDADRCTASRARAMIWMAHDVAFQGKLDRWAYVSFFSVCAPGQEDATFERMKKLIAAAVPEFQQVPQTGK